jgi:hypothetical protein
MFRSRKRESKFFVSKAKYSERNRSQCHFVRHKYRVSPDLVLNSFTAKANIHAVTNTGRYDEIAPNTRKTTQNWNSVGSYHEYTHDFCELPCRRQLFVNCGVNIYGITILGIAAVGKWGCIAAHQFEGCPSWWPRGLSLRSVAARLLGLWVRIPPVARMSAVNVVCYQRPLRRADPSSRVALPSVCISMCVMRRNNNPHTYIEEVKEVRRKKKSWRQKLLAIVKNISCRGEREEFYCFYFTGFLEQPVRVLHGKLNVMIFRRKKIKACQLKVGRGNIVFLS